MQDQCVAQSQLARLQKNIERILQARDTTRAPRLVPMNAQTIWARRRDVVLIVMMREVDVVHDIVPLAISGHAIRAPRCLDA